MAMAVGISHEHGPEMTAASSIGWKPTVKERAVYEHYLGGSTRGDLTVHVRRGRMGIMKPERSQGNAFAAWKAGETLAAREP